MIEAALFALVLAVVSYCCWIAFKANKKSVVKASDLGILCFKEAPMKGGK